MNDAHLHLLVNHFPIIVAILGLLILAAGLLLRSITVQRVAFAVFVLGALMTLPAMLTGEGAEDIAETLPGVTKQIIHRHEEAAETFAIFSYILGAMALLAFWASWQRKAIAGAAAVAVLLLSLATIFLAKEAGTSGGEIRHTEIRGDYAPTPTLEGDDD